MRHSSFRRRAAFLLAGGGLLLTVALAVGFRTGHPAPPNVPFSELLRRVNANEVKAIDIADDAMTITLHGGARFEAVAPAGFASVNPAFLPDLLRRGVQVQVRSAAQGPGLSSLLFGAALIGILGLAVHRLSGGRLPSMEGDVRRAGQGPDAVTFSDVAGVDEAKAEVAEVVDFLRQPARYAALGGRMPKGILLVGPPGTGKTLLARSIAGEAAVPFLYASGSDFVEMFAGVGAGRVRRLFKDARRHAACIIFIDELDAVGRSRGGQSISHEEREQTLNQLLVEMDGFAAHQGIVVIAATNRPDILDKALLRPGRFDRQVVVGNPDLRGREAILRVHTSKVPMDGQVDLHAVARGTPGFSGADLANLVNEAALLAARNGRVTIGPGELSDARDKVLLGAERRSLVMSEEERKTTAYHEAGHAVAALTLPLADPLHKVTIVPRGRALGVTMQLPEADRYTHSKDYLESQLAILMAGRVAEALFTGRITSGAGNDIERATDIARRMVCEFGMSSCGPVAFRRAGAPWEEDSTSGFSQATAERVDEEIRGLVMRAQERAREVLTSRGDAVEALAQALLETESLDADAVHALLLRSTDAIQVAARSATR